MFPIPSKFAGAGHYLHGSGGPSHELSHLFLHVRNRNIIYPHHSTHRRLLPGHSGGQQRSCQLDILGEYGIKE